MRVSAFLAFAVLITGAPVAQAQDQAGPSQATRDSVMAPVLALFNGMRARDTAMMRSAFAPGAVMGRAPRPGQAPKIDQVDGFIASIPGAPAGTLLDEQLYDVEIRIDGGLATVWTFYTFSLGARFSHCGVDAMQMVRTDAGWKIIAIADSMRQQNCGVEGKTKF